MENKEYKLGSKLKMKKVHPCGGDIFEVVRLGVDIKIKCCFCGHNILIPRIELNKKIKKVVGDE